MKLEVLCGKTLVAPKMYLTETSFPISGKKLNCKENILIQTLEASGLVIKFKFLE